jgi:transposase
MCEPIMVACDLHDKTMLLMLAQGRAEPEKVSVANSVAGRAKLIADLQERSRRAGGAELIFAYEASGLGFGLYDELTESGIACHVLAPTKIARSAQHGRRKTDEQDARQILHLLRGHVLAGNPLPGVWIPSLQTRDDRELVRLRIDLAQKRNAVKVQIKTLLKRAKLNRPSGCGRGWTKAFLGWLKEQSQQTSWGVGLRSVLASLLSQMQFLEGELQGVEQRLAELAASERYLPQTYALMKLPGVGALTALVFLTEMGDLKRFANRRQIGAYLGLSPSSHESGEQQDHKGHITRQGPARVRHILCQAAWATLLRKGNDYPAYERIVARNPKHKKIAVVAVMRRLAVRMWHEACDAQTKDRTAESPPAESTRRTKSRKQLPGLRGFSRSVHAKLNST